MPYLKITCPELPPEYKAIAETLTKEVIDLFYTSKARLSRDELREHTTIHFTPYQNAQLFIGGRTSAQRGIADITVELWDWNLSVTMQRRVAKVLTSVLSSLFHQSDRDAINIHFHSYAPTDFAVGGMLLSDRIPLMGRLAKRLSS